MVPVPQGFAQSDTDFAERYRDERARWLRKRMLWYCGVMLFILIFSMISTIWDLIAFIWHGQFEEWMNSDSLLDLGGDLALLSVYLGAAFVVVRAPPRRRTIVLTMNWVVLLAAGMTMLGAPLSVYLDSAGGTAEGWSRNETAVMVGAAGLFVLHFLGSLFVALTPRESLWPLIPLAITFIVVTLTLNPGEPWVRAVLIAGLIPAAAPGVLWASWRSRRFDEQFTTRALEGRLGELQGELASARRVHEALFPPPVARGPVRVAYEYEPMREIGGDFLHIHPLAFPPSESSGIMTVTLVDVSGHGLAAALAVNRLHGEMLRLFADGTDHSPRKLLQAMNDYARIAVAPQGIYATAISLQLDPVRRELRWANAGHPPAYIRSPDGPLEPLGATATMLGVLSRDLYAVEEHVRELRDDECVVAYTDGVTEARGSGGEFFGDDRLREALSRATAKSDCGSVARAIIRAVNQFRRGRANDDTLVVEARFVVESSDDRT